MEPTEVSFRLGGLGYLTRGSIEEEKPVDSLSPGYLTWGRKEGCDFLRKSAREWSSRYKCTKHLDHGCTADNKNGAVCSLVTDWEVRSYASVLLRLIKSKC